MLTHNMDAAGPQDTARQKTQINSATQTVSEGFYDNDDLLEQSQLNSARIQGSFKCRRKIEF